MTLAQPPSPQFADAGLDPDLTIETSAQVTSKRLLTQARNFFWGFATPPQEGRPFRRELRELSALGAWDYLRSCLARVPTEARADQFWQAFRRLPPDEQIVLFLGERLGLDLRLFRPTAGCSEASVHYLHERALDRLADHLDLIPDPKARASQVYPSADSALSRRALSATAVRNYQVLSREPNSPPVQRACLASVRLQLFSRMIGLAWRGSALSCLLALLFSTSVSHTQTHRVAHRPASPLPPAGAYQVGYGHTQVAPLPPYGNDNAEDVDAPEVPDSGDEEIAHRCSVRSRSGGRLWRFHLHPLDAEWVKHRIRELVGPRAQEGLFKETRVPGGTRFDLTLEDAAIPTLRKILTELSPSALPSSSPLSWYNMPAKKRLPCGFAQVLIWVAGEGD